MKFTATARSLGIFSAAVTVILLVAYTVTLTVGLASLESPDQPIGDPMFTILEVLIILTTRRARSPVPMRSSRPLAASGLSNLSDNLTLLPDEKDGPSSGLSRAPSGQQLEPDDNKYLTYAGYSGHRRVRRVIREGMREDIRGNWEDENREMVLWRC
jgi:hypothetical protein